MGTFVSEPNKGKSLWLGACLCVLRRGYPGGRTPIWGRYIYEKSWIGGPPTLRPTRKPVPRFMSPRGPWMCPLSNLIFLVQVPVLCLHARHCLAGHHPVSVHFLIQSWKEWESPPSAPRVWLPGSPALEPASVWRDQWSEQNWSIHPGPEDGEYPALWVVTGQKGFVLWTPAHCSLMISWFCLLCSPVCPWVASTSSYWVGVWAEAGSLFLDQKGLVLCSSVGASPWPLLLSLWTLCFYGHQQFLWRSLWVQPPHYSSHFLFSF